MPLTCILQPHHSVLAMAIDRQIIELLSSVLEDHPEIQCCYLYGSAAQGRMAPSSDVDVAVAGFRPLTGDERAELQGDLEVALGRDVDLVDLLCVTGTILRNAVRGVCVLCRDTGVKYRVMRRLVYDQEDLQPLRQRMMDRRREVFAHGH